MGSNFTPKFTPMKITIEDHCGRLRLRWQYEGKRYTMAVGVNNDATGNAVARKKSSEIELDMQAGYFDPTLLKYKPKIFGKTATEITAPELFAKFTQNQAKEKNLANRSIEARYTPILRYLERSLNVPLHQVTERLAGDFAALQLENVTARTAKERLWLLKSCWDWAKGKYHVTEENPWTNQIKRIKPSPQTKRVKPFSKAEILAILNAFKNHPHYQHYYPLVSFLFGTACRFGEAVGLKWKNVDDDFNNVFICESVSRGEHRNTTKTGKSRYVVLSPAIATMLRSLKEQTKPSPDDLVFPSPKGGAIDDHNFNRRAWHTIINQLGIEYRKPYSTRHTAISHALENGANYLQVAEASGHNPKVMHQSYASVIQAQSVFVEF